MSSSDFSPTEHIGVPEALTRAHGRRHGPGSFGRIRTAFFATCGCVQNQTPQQIAEALNRSISCDHDARRAPWPSAPLGAGAQTRAPSFG